MTISILSPRARSLKLATLATLLALLGACVRTRLRAEQGHIGLQQLYGVRESAEPATGCHPEPDRGRSPDLPACADGAYAGPISQPAADHPTAAPAALLPGPERRFRPIHRHLSLILAEGR